jgi:hypothetical protein
VVRRYPEDRKRIASPERPARSNYIQHYSSRVWKEVREVGRFVRTIVLSAAALLVCAGSFDAGEIDVLLEKLIDKGVLTPVEAQVIRDKTKAAVAKDIARGVHPSVPSWAQKIKLKGDLRLRYQMDDVEGADTDRHRGRVRFRLGLEAKVFKGFSVGAGLATGGTDPRSTNETLDNSFETPDIRLDYAYAKYTPPAMPKISVYGGKFKRKSVLWTPTDLLWDSDINTDGLGFTAWHPLRSNLDISVNTAYLLIDEVRAAGEPSVFALQPMAAWDVQGNGQWTLKAALTYYAFGSVEGRAMDHSDGENSVDANGDLIYDYDSLSTGIEFGWHTLATEEDDPPFFRYIALVLDHVHNFDASDDGICIGFKAGDKKVSKDRTWQFKYLHRHMARNAWLDIFPDSDTVDGTGAVTDITSDEFIFQYAIKKNVIVGLDYYLTRTIHDPSADRNILQIDFLLKF